MFPTERTSNSSSSKGKSVDTGVRFDASPTTAQKPPLSTTDPLYEKSWTSGVSATSSRLHSDHRVFMGHPQVIASRQSTEDISANSLLLRAVSLLSEQLDNLTLRMDVLERSTSTGQQQVGMVFEEVKRVASLCEGGIALTRKMYRDGPRHAKGARRSRSRPSTPSIHRDSRLYRPSEIIEVDSDDAQTTMSQAVAKDTARVFQRGGPLVSPSGSFRAATAFATAAVAVEDYAPLAKSVVDLASDGVRLGASATQAVATTVRTIGSVADTSLALAGVPVSAVSGAARVVGQSTAVINSLVGTATSLANASQAVVDSAAGIAVAADSLMQVGTAPLRLTASLLNAAAPLTGPLALPVYGMAAGAAATGMALRATTAVPRAALGGASLLTGVASSSVRAGAGLVGAASSLVGAGASIVQTGTVLADGGVSLARAAVHTTTAAGGAAAAVVGSGLGTAGLSLSVTSGVLDVSIRAARAATNVEDSIQTHERAWAAGSRALYVLDRANAVVQRLPFMDSAG